MSARLVLVPTAGVGAGLMVVVVEGVVGEVVEEVVAGVGDMGEGMVVGKDGDTNWRLTFIFPSRLWC